MPGITNKEVGETSCVLQLMNNFTVLFSSLILLLVMTRFSSKSVFIIEHECGLGK